ncbi:hypothetical protein C1645_785781, partial [Glomus cerebriforme]
TMLYNSKIKFTIYFFFRINFSFLNIRAFWHLKVLYLTYFFLFFSIRSTN